MLSDLLETSPYDKSETTPAISYDNGVRVKFPPISNSDGLCSKSISLVNPAGVEPGGINPRPCFSPSITLETP